MGNRPEMSTWNFRLTLEPTSVSVDEVFDKLQDAGCDDALFSSRDQREFVTFARRAPTLEEAVLTAIADLESVEGIKVAEIYDESLVTFNEIAHRAGKSVESMAALLGQQRTGAAFPSPLTWDDDEPQEWQWSRVAEWFANELGEHPRDPHSAVFAAFAATLSARRSCGRLSPDQRRKISGLLSSS